MVAQEGRHADGVDAACCVRGRGGANVGIFTPMPIPEELRILLNTTRSNGEHRRPDGP
ncbi:hypothetical protein D187_009242 [Cystobacter fuscus DSM 2262]|uniref:Uncharacterized protein n=1 Tax=Cystobacter fuscus (strain ATCC 25194 / DSM 2262 / NBRC 100088 / M29) TaxID=1242864 RepID=S9NXQ8_CYSF2|nr:hypothetical protein D187_009242 [Cystobacter fuscus DSM 2262]